jgi:hypothetical protein
MRFALGGHRLPPPVPHPRGATVAELLSLSLSLSLTLIRRLVLHRSRFLFRDSRQRPGSTDIFSFCPLILTPRDQRAPLSSSAARDISSWGHQTDQRHPDPWLHRTSASLSLSLSLSLSRNTVTPARFCSLEAIRTFLKPL